ncbi:MAG: carboxylating nicotinate-nucleotide diphosphorylase [Planctomycetota bacterium]
MNFINSLINLALKEDIGTGDITSNILIPASQTSTAIIIAKEPGIIAGLGLIQPIYRRLSNKVKVTLKKKDGARINKDAVVAIIKGPTRAILSGERTVLNFIQRLSGIATLTSQFVAKAKPYGVKILDTRKTVPGWRLLDKYAVKAGGGFNHRIGLYDAILIKNNHLKNTPAIKALELVSKSPMTKNRPIEIEVTNLYEFIIALILLNANVSHPSIIMLDNMTPKEIKEAVHIRNRVAGEVRLEASGGITLKNISRFAATGVDYISIGALTHSPKALDIALRVT